MSKPLGYFTSAMPNDGSLLDEMQEIWGSTFSALNDAHRYWMIMELALISKRRRSSARE